MADVAARHEAFPAAPLPAVNAEHPNEERDAIGRRVFIVGVAGPSGVGKSSLARNLAKTLNSPVKPIAPDSFFLTRQQRETRTQGGASLLVVPVLVLVIVLALLILVPVLRSRRAALSLTRPHRSRGQ